MNYLYTLDNYLPLFKCKSIFIKDSKIKGYNLKRNGLLSLHNLTYELDLSEKSIN